MADVMVAVMPSVVTLALLAAVTAAFVEAGHAVRVYTGTAYADRFAALGAEIVPWSRAPDFDEHDLARPPERCAGGRACCRRSRISSTCSSGPPLHRATTSWPRTGHAHGT